MSRHYSTRDLFCQMPNALPARYFAARGALQDFDLGARKETKVDVLFDAWMALPEPCADAHGISAGECPLRNSWRTG
jgi:hypothetical protein